MDFLKAIFGDKPITFDEFVAAVGVSGIKLANLADGQYVDKSKYEALKGQFTEANTKIGELSGSIKALEGADETVKTLRKQVEDYETAENDRKVAEQKAAEDAALLATFETVVKDKKFVNDFTETAIFDACKAELAKPENKGKGISDVFAALTADKPGIFANGNPQFNYGNAHNMGGDEMTAEAFNKLTLIEQMQFARNNPADYERITKTE